MHPSAADLAMEVFLPVIEKQAVELRAPDISADTMMGVALEAKKVLRIEPTVLRLVTDIVIVGDIHGNLWDLYRILNVCGLPPVTKYLFLGDLVDRGTHSAHACCLVFAMKVKWPESVFVIRGNHEYRDLGLRGGFYSDTKVMYPMHDVFGLFVETFDFLPLAAIIDHKVFCVHGGIAPGNIIDQLNEFQRPVPKDKERLVNDLLWSDPGHDVTGFEPSKRGGGHIFGSDAVKSFLSASGMEMIIRGHECVNEGYRYSFDNTLLTLFSASGYCGCMDNRGAVCKLKKDMKCEFFTWSVDKDITDGKVLVIDDRIGKKYKGGRTPTQLHCGAMRVGYTRPSGLKERKMLASQVSLPKMVGKGFKPYSLLGKDAKKLNIGVSFPLLDSISKRKSTPFDSFQEDDGDNE